MPSIGITPPPVAVASGGGITQAQLNAALAALPVPEQRDLIFNPDAPIATGDYDLIAGFKFSLYVFIQISVRSTSHRSTTPPRVFTFYNNVERFGASDIGNSEDSDFFVIKTSDTTINIAVDVKRIDADGVYHIWGIRGTNNI